MSRWLIISTAIIVAQFVLGYIVGGLLRRASAETRASSEPAGSSVLAFPRRVMPRRHSGARRAVNH